MYYGESLSRPGLISPPQFRSLLLAFEREICHLHRVYETKAEIEPNEGRRLSKI